MSYEACIEEGKILTKDALTVFETLPDLYLVLSPDLRILTASNLYLQSSYTKRAYLVGKSIREAFPYEPGTPEERTIIKLESALRQMLTDKQPCHTPVQCYKSSQSGDSNSIQYWCSFNTPVLGEQGEVQYIIHKVENVSEFVYQEQQVNLLEKNLSEEVEVRRNLEVSQDLLKAAEEVAQMGNYELDLASNAIILSDGMYRLLGEEPQAFLSGLDYIDSRSDPDDVAAIREILAQAIIEKKPYSYTRRFQRKDGEWRIAETHGRVVCDSTGKTCKLFGVVQDVTERKKAEQELRESKLLIEQIMDATPDFVMVFNLVTQKTEFVNRSAYKGDEERYHETLSIDYDQILSRAHPDDREHLHHYIQNFKTAQDDEICTLDYRVLKEEQALWYRSRGKVFKRNAHGVPTHYISIIHDITERKHAEQELLRIKDELTQKATDKYLALFNSIDEGFNMIEMLFDEQGKAVDYLILEVNPAQERIMGVGDIVGKRAKEIVPDLDEHWLEQFGQVALSGVSVRMENYVKSLDRWFTLHASKIGDECSHQVALVFDDITERKRIEKELRESEEKKAFLLKLSDALRPLNNPVEVQSTALRILGETLQVSRVHYGEIVADGSFLQVTCNYTNGVPVLTGTFRMEDFGSEVVNKLRSGHKIVMTDLSKEPSVSEAEITANASVGIKAQVGVPLVKDDRFTAILAVHNAEPRDWTAHEIAIIEETAERTWAAVERARAKEALQQSEERLQKAISISTVGVIFFHLDEGIKDTNEAYRRMSGYSQEEFLSGKIRWDKVIAPEFLEMTLKANEELLTKGQNTPFEKQYIRPDGSRWWGLFAGKRLSEKECVGFIIDITERKSAEQKLQEFNGLLEEQINERTNALQQSKEHFEAAINVSPVALAIVKSIRNDQQQITDFYIDWVSKSGGIMAGRNVVGFLLTEQFPYIQKTGLLQKFINTVETGEPTDFEYNFRHEDVNKWYRWKSVKLNDGLFVSVEDVTEPKRTQEALKEEHRRLKESQAIGHVGTFEWSTATNVFYWSDEMYRIHGLEPQAEPMTFERVLSLVHPDDVSWVRERFSKSRQQVSTGTVTHRIVRTDGQVRYIQRTFESFADTSGEFMYLNGTAQDITDIKRYEHSILKHLALLRQSEEVAGMGSWEYDMASDSMQWSETMYRLFGLPLGSSITPDIYLDYVLKEDLSIAEKLIHTLRSAPEPLEETLRIKVNHKVLTLKIKAVVLRNEYGKPTGMLGIDLDVSEVKRLEQENLQMRLEQQKALLLAILEAQEEERRRISESLHNGVCQILYASKLQLDQVAMRVEQESGDDFGLQTTLNTLTEAINETRKVSHELVPMLLKEFGLEEALEHMCRKYENSSLYVGCDIEGLESRLERHLEVALFRICQELINNVAKHARATSARITLRKETEQILLQVQDNGKGLTYEESNTQGIGLKTISDRIALLGGTFCFKKPRNGKGTIISIMIPLE